MSSIWVFLSGMCVSALLISLSGLVVIWLLARHAPFMDCDEEDHHG